MYVLKNKHWIGILREPEVEEDQSKPGKGPFCRKQKNVAKPGARLRGLQARESDGGVSQVPCVPNRINGYTITTTFVIQ
jgi:hypothetical protein